jgi:hypothetical protein
VQQLSLAAPQSVRPAPLVWQLDGVTQAPFTHDWLEEHAAPFCHVPLALHVRGWIPEAQPTAPGVHTPASAGAASTEVSAAASAREPVSAGAPSPDGASGAVFAPSAGEPASTSPPESAELEPLDPPEDPPEAELPEPELPEVETPELELPVLEPPVLEPRTPEEAPEEEDDDASGDEPSLPPPASPATVLVVDPPQAAIAASVAAVDHSIHARRIKAMSPLPARKRREGRPESGYPAPRHDESSKRVHQH